MLSYICREYFVLENFLFLSRFLEMVQWMDKVDINLQNIVKEVNTLEEFEKERAVFQVCLNAFQIWCVWFIFICLVLWSCLAVGATSCLLQHINMINKYQYAVKEKYRHCFMNWPSCNSILHVEVSLVNLGTNKDRNYFCRVPVFQIFYANVYTVW